MTIINCEWTKLTWCVFLPGTRSTMPLPSSSSSSTISLDNLRVCRLCGQSFSHILALKRHLVSHTGVKRITCRVCGKMFSRNDNLKTHMRTHTGEKPYKCDICDRDFAQKIHLQDHLARIHPRNWTVTCGHTIDSTVVGFRKILLLWSIVTVHGNIYCHIVYATFNTWMSLCHRSLKSRVWEASDQQLFT